MTNSNSTCAAILPLPCTLHTACVKHTPALTVRQVALLRTQWPGLILMWCCGLTAAIVMGGRGGVCVCECGYMPHGGLAIKTTQKSALPELKHTHPYRWPAHTWKTLVGIVKPPLYFCYGSGCWGGVVSVIYVDFKSQCDVRQRSACPPTEID